MKTVHFVRQNDEQLIVIDCKIYNHKVLLALDTGASHTTIDLAALIIAGYSLSDAIKEVDIETASGVIKGFVFLIKKIQSHKYRINQCRSLRLRFFCPSSTHRF